MSVSATSAGLLPSAAHTPYLPPHPARGTPYHRYVLLLLPHEDPTLKLSLPPGPLERDAFDLRRFVQEHALRTDGGGAFMWRAVWDEESSRIWETVISKHSSYMFSESERLIIFVVQKNRSLGMDILLSQTPMRL